MKSSDKLYYGIRLLVLGMLLVGCAKNVAIEREEGETALPGVQTPTKSIQLPPTWTIQITPTETSTPTSTSTPTFNPRPTTDLPQLPRLNAEEKVEKYIELMETNAGCKLPCWWGIVPGETSWPEARRFLRRVADSVTTNWNPQEAKFRVPDYISSYELSHRYYVEDEIIQIVMVQTGMLPVNSVSNILNTYGKPDEVYLVLEWEPGRIDLPISLTLLYLTQGFRVSYGVQGSELTENIRACFDKDLSGGFILWSPNNQASYEWVMQYISAVVPNIFHPIDEITKMDVDAFYDLFSHGYAETCIYVIKEELYIK